MTATLVLVLVVRLDNGDDGQGESAPRSPGPTTRAPAVAAGSPDRVVTPRCRDGDVVAVGRSGLDATLGRRYLALYVRNCTARALTLTRPVVTGVTDRGRTGVLRTTVTVVANRAERPFSLGPHRAAAAGISWRAEPRDDRVVALRVAVGPGGRPAPLPLDLLEVRLTTPLDYYPWVARAADVFSS